MSLEDFLRGHSELGAAENPKAYRKQEAIWELFTSECVYFLDQLMVLKEVWTQCLQNYEMTWILQWKRQTVKNRVLATVCRMVTVAVIK